jgi:hypothetical protein
VEVFLNLQLWVLVILQFETALYISCCSMLLPWVEVHVQPFPADAEGFEASAVLVMTKYFIPLCKYIVACSAVV